jgi:hypothetical protein
MAKIDDAAMSWAHGFTCGMEFLALAYEAWVDGGQAAGLLFVEQLVMSTQDRARVVDLFRGGLGYGQQTATD